MRNFSLILLTALLMVSAQAESIDQKLESAKVVKTGAFSGASGHTKGQVQLVRTGDDHYLHLGKNFLFDGALDPKLGFSRGDQFDTESIFTPLKENEGQQLYKLPQGFDPSQYDAATLWCQKFRVPLGQARWK